ncbi:hypothetical protein SAY87_007438 [Trapa incisa]|uniref:Uncharacterized protein n=1 Tax=Trapa incisa TaxID=236973 RepID=A0AAN7QEZ5_9MYRT|nr:hypothetical protein SAY87_007438 [Trapa incisa]
MSKDERMWSAKGMEEDEGLKRTIECLRGRLVAERQCSRAAKENADQLDKKLKELEDKLREESKMRDTAEKKLRLLERKLESLKASGKQPSSSVSENSLTSSCDSSVATTVASGAFKRPQEPESDSQIRSLMRKNMDHDDPESAQRKRRNESFCTGDDHNSGITEISSESGHEKVCSDQEASRPNDHSEVPEKEGDDGANNSLALVAVNYAVVEESQQRELKVISTSVGEALEALRLAREGIQRSMRHRQKQQMIMFVT